MTPSQQKSKALADKLKAERRLNGPMTRWAVDIVKSYRIGQDRISEDSVIALGQILREFYNQTALDVLTFDIREFKQDEPVRESIFRRIAGVLSNIFFNRIPQQVRSITNTTNKFLARTNELAITEDLGQIGATRTLANYMRNHKGTILMTESQWVVETTRFVAVNEISQPLKRLAEDITDFLTADRFDDARGLIDQFRDFVKLPTSQSQGELVNTVLKNKDVALNPVTKETAISRISRSAQKLARNEKKWQTIGDGKVRTTHSEANGQTVDIEDNFRVGGSILRWPGDGSLGAALAEIINCRCTSIYT